MNVYRTDDISTLLCGNPYVGRGIVIGKSQDGRRAVCAYFIMGRSENSRNRVFVEREGALYTEPFDAAKVEDPSLILYAALRKCGNALVVTNGDQTDTVCAGLQSGKSFSEALRARSFEPDAPHFTPRISGILNFADGDFSYEMSILKSEDEHGSACARYTFSYAPLPGLGHFIHTYMTNGAPLPTFTGEPERVAIPDDIDVFANSLWNALDPDNRISLYVRYVSLANGKEENRLYNRNK